MGAVRDEWGQSNSMLAQAILQGELTGPQDFAKIHAYAGYVKMLEARLREARKMVAEAMDDLRKWKEASADRVLSLVERYGEATSSGGKIIRSALGSSHIQTSKSRRWRVTDEEAAVKWVRDRAGVSWEQIESHDGFKVSVGLSATGKDRLFKIAAELLDETGEIPEGVDYVEAGTKSVVHKTASSRGGIPPLAARIVVELDDSPAEAPALVHGSEGHEDD